MPDKNKKVRSENKKMWAYFSPDGNIQVRSIGETRKETKEMVVSGEPFVTWQNYEKEGYTLHQINFIVDVLN